MKLYHYVTKGNTVLEKGILSFAQNPNADLNYYYKRTGGRTTHEEITAWMESCFVGRSRGIRAFSEPIRWTDKSRSLEAFVKNADMFSIDVEALAKDGLLEALYVSPSVMDMPELVESKDCDEVLQKISGVEKIDYSPIDWSVCNDELGWRFAFVRYYLMVIKGGFIPTKYIALEA